MKEQTIYEEYEKLVFSDLGICGCGTPEETIEMIVEYLKHNIEYKNKYKIEKDFDKVYKEDKEWEERFIEENKELLFLFMLYILDDKEFMEHGTSVYSSWVIKKGEKLISLFEKMG